MALEDPLTKRERRHIRDNDPILSNRPWGVDLPLILAQMMEAVQAAIDNLHPVEAFEVVYDDAVTMFGVDNVQDAIEAFFTNNNTWTGTQDFQGAITTDAVYRNVRLIGATVSALPSDHIVVQVSGGSITYALPVATGFGRELAVKKRTTAGSGNLTIDPDGAETIDGGATVVLKRENDSVTLVDHTSGAWIIT